MSSSNYSKKQLKLHNAFNPTKPYEELLKIFRQMKNCFDQGDLSNECLTLVKSLQQANRQQDARLFTKKVNKMLLFGNDDDCPNCFLAHNFDFVNANVLNSMGSSCVDAKNYAQGLKYLNLANAILTSEFDEVDDSRCDGNCVLTSKANNFYKLHKIGLFTGKFDESAAYAIKHLEIKEKLVKEGCMEIALANLDVCYAYSAAMKYRDAIPYGWKALGIQTKCLGRKSVEVAKLRFDLSFMYRQLGEYDMALELEELSNKVLRRKARDAPDMLLKAGKYEEAIRVLEGEVSRVDISEEERVLNFLSMSRASYKLEKYADAKKHFMTADEILQRGTGMLTPMYVASSLLEMSEMYETMDDTEGAISLIKRALEVPDLPQNMLSQGVSSLVSLIPESGKAREEIPDMLSVVEKLKVVFGSESREVGYVYAHLGVAYWSSGQQELAVKFLADSKGILDATIGPNHINSLKASHTLSEVYGKMGRCTQALEIEEKVVGVLKGIARSEQGFLHEANKHLSKLKERVAESTTAASSQAKDGGIFAKISKWHISGDGKGT